MPTDTFAKRIGTAIGTAIKSITLSVSDVSTRIGTMAGLSTTTKTNLVSAINEVYSATNSINKSTLGLGNVENKSSATIRGELTSGNVTTALGFTPEDTARKNVANGYAGLDNTAKIPSSLLPSYVDDVLEFNLITDLPAVGETGKIYLTADNKQYRWSGSAYVVITSSPGSTDAVPEGSINQYFTTSRAQLAVASDISSAISGVIGGASSGGNTLKKLEDTIASISLGTITSGDSNVTISDTGSSSTVRMTLDGNELMRLGTYYTISLDALPTPAGNNSTTNSFLTIYNPRGGIRIFGSRSDTNSASTANGGTVWMTGGYGATGSNANGGSGNFTGGNGDGTGTGGSSTVQGGTGGTSGAGGNGYTRGGNAGGVGAGGNAYLLAGRGGTTSGVGGFAQVVGGTATIGDGGFITIAGGNGGTTSGNGGAVGVFGGGATNGSGGIVDIHGGNGTGTDKNGGYVNIYGGTSTGAANGPAVVITGGQAAGTGNGGAVAISAGSVTAGNGGDVDIRASSGVGGSNAGGAVAYRTGLYADGVNTGNHFWYMGPSEAALELAKDPGGSAYRFLVLGPTGSGATTGNGMHFSIWGSDGGSTSGNGGDVQFRSGNAANGNGGSFWIQAGNAAGTGKNGGYTYILGGTVTDGDGGGVVIRAQNAAGTNRNGGAVILTTGTKTGTGADGNVILDIVGSGCARPNQDNVNSLGTSAQRWSTIYAGTGTISTSDARLKTQLTPLSVAEISAAREIGDTIGTFRFLEAISLKGDGARLHCGVTVQSTMEIMRRYGLDPGQYAFICYDRWDATENIPAGDRYSLRYDELIMFLMRAYAERQDILERRIAALEVTNI